MSSGGCGIWGAPAPYYSNHAYGSPRNGGVKVRRGSTQSWWIQQQRRHWPHTFVLPPSDRASRAAWETARPHPRPRRTACVDDRRETPPASSR